MPLRLRRMVGGLIAAVPVAAWDRAGAVAAGVVAISRPGDKAHKLAARLNEVRDLDDLTLAWFPNGPDIGW